MQIPILCWAIIVISLWVSNFGIWCSVMSCLCCVVVLLGAALYVYTKNQDVAAAFLQHISCTADIKGMRPGVRKVVELTGHQRPSDQDKLDKRLTGSQVIDESLQEIIGFLLQDHVFPWYDRVSSDSELCHHIRDAGQKVVINIANRIKQVDWVPYLTTQLVDDAASHLRLYRQACLKTKRRRADAKLKPSPSSNKPQSLAKFKSATEQNSNELKSHSRSPSGSGMVTGHSRNNSTSGAVTGSVNSLEASPQQPPPPVDELEQCFFDLELSMEEYKLCRDAVCMDKDAERRFLQDLVDVLLFFLLPPSDFHCLNLRSLLRELVVGGVLLPVLSALTDPDYVNLTIIWLCKDVVITPEAFLLTLRITDSLEELQVTREMVNREIALLRFRDSGGTDDVIVKQQLSSMLYVKKVLDSRLTRLEAGLDTDSSGVGSDSLLQPQPGVKLMNLPLDVILKNNVALSYLIDYLSSVELESYIFLYLNIEGWKASAEQLLYDTSATGQDGDTKPARSNVDNMREAALSIYNQYFSEKSSHKVKIDDQQAVEKLFSKLGREEVKETWFDEIQTSLHYKLQNQDKFLQGFYKSSSYVRLLSELELLKDTDDDTQSLDNVSLSDNASVASYDAAEVSADTTADCHATVEAENKLAMAKSVPSSGQGALTLSADIIDTGVVQDRGKTYGIYALFVVKTYENGYSENWHVYRRYSDFHDLQQKVRDSYSSLGKLTFPGKKTFHNMERSTLEKRMKMLNDYLQILLQCAVARTHNKLPEMLLAFLEPGEYDKSSGPFAKTFDSLVNPFKSSMRTVGQAVRTMPDNLLSTVDGVFDGLTRVFQTRSKHYEDTIRVGAGIQQNADDNIPLRIMLLLLDEIFELKSRNQWLRRQIVTVLRQVIRTMFGDIVNKKIVDYVSLATDPHQVAVYLATFKQSMWPNGARAVPPATRDEATKLRTRVLAKAALLSWSDELKHVLGSDTTRRGIMRVLQLFQHPVLNRRLVYVLLEGILTTSFSQHNLAAIFKTIHSRSPRVTASGRKVK